MAQWLTGMDPCLDVPSFEIACIYAFLCHQFTTSRPSSRPLRLLPLYKTHDCVIVDNGKEAQRTLPIAVELQAETARPVRSIREDAAGARRGERAVRPGAEEGGADREEGCSSSSSHSKGA